ncbi:MAG: AEC family transporter [Clostridia bacterium]|nr:AEC family transporter [Clostridia bacterium]
MIAQLLLYKILQLFLIMILGFVFVKAKLVKSGDSAVLSRLSLYLFMPSVIINAFNVEVTSDIMKGLMIAFLLAVLIHIVLLLVDLVLKKYFKATKVERASIVYSNSGNLIVPIVTYVLGEEWLIYSSAFLIVQLVFFWTHGVKLFSDQKVGLKKILLNINVIAVVVGFVMLFSGIRLPNFVSEITSSLGAMVAPVGMIIAGMLAASVDFGKMLKNKRLYFVLLGRLIVCPVIVMFLMRGILPFIGIANIHTIMLISYFASITPTAATVMQFSQIHGKDFDYATAINVITTIGCIISMPLLIMIFNSVVI